MKKKKARVIWVVEDTSSEDGIFPVLYDKKYEAVSTASMYNDRLSFETKAFKPVKFIEAV